MPLARVRVHPPHFLLRLFFVVFSLSRPSVCRPFPRFPSLFSQLSACCCNGQRGRGEGRRNSEFGRLASQHAQARGAFKVSNFALVEHDSRSRGPDFPGQLRKHISNEILTPRSLANSTQSTIDLPPAAAVLANPLNTIGSRHVVVKEGGRDGTGLARGEVVAEVKKKKPHRKI